MLKFRPGTNSWFNQSRSAPRFSQHPLVSTCYRAWLAYPALCPEFSSLGSGDSSPPKALSYIIQTLSLSAFPLSSLPLPPLFCLLLHGNFPGSIPWDQWTLPRAVCTKLAFIYSNLAWIGLFLSEEKSINKEERERVEAMEEEEDKEMEEQE